MRRMQRPRLARRFPNDQLTGKPQVINLLDNLTAAEPAPLQPSETTCALDRCCSMAANLTAASAFFDPRQCLLFGVLARASHCHHNRFSAMRLADRSMARRSYAGGYGKAAKRVPYLTRISSGAPCEFANWEQSIFCFCPYPAPSQDGAAARAESCQPNL